MRIYDISMAISENMLVYPRNIRPKIIGIQRRSKASTNLSKLILGSHTGTHVDARRHINDSESGAERLKLNTFYGSCKVLDLTKCSEKVSKNDLKKFNIVKDDIILLKTKNSLRGYNKFRKDFVYLAEDAAEYLAKRGMKTLGVDYLSVQRFHSGNQKVHRKIISNMTLFEGLDLSKVRPGKYLFLGLPLKIKGCDGAPARVILIKK